MKTMRASKIGFPCDRNLYYAVNGHNEKINDGTMRIFAVGTALESVIVEWLRDDGWDVFYNPGSQGADMKLDIPVAGGVISGHPDCIISRDGTGRLLVDVKTMNDRAFARWKSEGTEKNKPQYVDQVHVYADAALAAGMNIDRLGVVGVNKNNSAMHIDVFDFSIERMAGLKERAERIFALDTAPEPGDRMEGWCCRYCGYSDICELVQKDDVEVGDGISVTTEPDIVNAMELLLEARELSKTGKELEDEAKAVLDERISKQGIKSVRGGSLILTLSESVRSSFDSTAFKKAHPDMANEFTKKTKSIMYKIKEAI